MMAEVRLRAAIALLRLDCWAYANAARPGG